MIKHCDRHGGPVTDECDEACVFDTLPTSDAEGRRENQGVTELARRVGLRLDASWTAATVDTAKMEALLPGVREAVKAADARGGAVDASTIATPEMMDMWRSAPVHAYSNGVRFDGDGVVRAESEPAPTIAHEQPRLMTPGDPVLPTLAALRRMETQGVADDAKRDAAVSISGTPATMLGEALAAMEKAKDLIRRTPRASDALAVDALRRLDIASDRVRGMLREEVAEGSPGEGR